MMQIIDLQCNAFKANKNR